jgi:hypothetical protein
MALLKSGDTYACRLYRTNVVTFHASGTIVADLTYGSLSTRDFANCFLPLGICCTSDAGNETISDADGAYYAGSKAIEVRGNRVSRDTVPLMGVKRVDRKKTAAPRAAIQPLLAYAKALAAITEADGLSREARDAMKPYAPEAYLQHATMERLSNPENWPSIVSNSMQSGWMYRFGESRYHLNYERFAKQVRETAYTLTGAYYIEPLPVGTVHNHMEPINK